MKKKLFKIAVCGESDFKRTYISRTIEKSFFAHILKEHGFFKHSIITMPVNIHTGTIIEVKEERSIEIWDFGGLPSFREAGVLGGLCRGIRAVVVCVDLEELIETKEVSKWIQLFSSNIPKILIGKKDLGKSSCTEDSSMIMANLEHYGFTEYHELSIRDYRSAINIIRTLLIEEVERDHTHQNYDLVTKTHISKVGMQNKSIA